MKQEAADRFWARVDRDGPIPAHVPEIGPCWLWTGAINGSGYGNVRVDGAVRPTHRVSFEIAIGPVPVGLEVCHRCDNRPCVRPDHLFVGTSRDNKQDSVRKGRARGGGAKHLLGQHINVGSNVAIRARLAASESPYAIALDFGVSYWTINRIRRGSNWRHV